MMYSIRLAETPDLALLPDIERAAGKLFPREDVPAGAGDATSSIDELEEARAAGLLWVAVDGTSTPVGFAHLVRMEQHIHLEELDVHPDHGRRGLGRELVTAVIDWARGRGYPAVTLTTFRHIPWNAPFYESMGFVRLDEAELSEALREELDWEASQGLDRAKRVAMRKELR